MPSDAQILLLSGPQVQALLTRDGVVAAVREAFILHSERQGRVFPVVRERLSTGGVFGIKSGDVEAQGLLGFKAAGFWPANRALGGEPHQATIMLFDPVTGRPACLIDGNMVTTVRTGAAGRIGLELLARPDSTDLCVFGTGVQARIQVDLALDCLPGLTRVRYVTPNQEPDDSFEAAVVKRCEVTHVADPDHAVSASDIVITATPGFGPLFSAEAVRPGTHINAVGADTKGKRELPEGLLAKARLFVDDREQSRSLGEGQWADTVEATEIGDVLVSGKAISRSADDITVFDMTGLALQDLTVARMLHERALSSGKGTQIPWPW